MNIDPSFSKSPYLSSPIRPVPSTSKSRTPSSSTKKDGIAPLRDIIVSSKSPTSLLRSSASRSRSAGRQRLPHNVDHAADDCCASVADSTIATTARPSPYLMGAPSSAGARRGAPSTKHPPKLLLMPDEVDEMLLDFKRRQHEEGKLVLFNTKCEGDDDDGRGEDADEEYSSVDEEGETSFDG